ncbi:MAG: ABC transporter ATP-binding protein [Rhodobacteraceae bacterium]|jgi:peptide/nickel transport system ATP-binding protein|nr:ABC transporter ATP-binding protein [Paracoccaceae bacterium]
MLTIRDLRVSVGPLELVHIERLDIAQGRRVGLVGESGSGKSITAMSIAGLQPREARLAGSVRFEDRELVGLSDAAMAKVRGARIGFIPQDPTRALNPTTRVGPQVAEALRLNTDLGGAAIRARVLELFAQVRLPEPEVLYQRYPHQISGGQQQRVLIAMAIAARPQLLIADEPTTALDVTVQNEILRLILDLSRAQRMALLFVSHELGVVRAVCDDIGVIYGGRMVELASAGALAETPRHRYTAALIGANPGLPGGDEIAAMTGRRFAVIEGSVPAAGRFPAGCRFRNRCRHATAACAEDPPITPQGGNGWVKCWHPVGTEAGR